MKYKLLFSIAPIIIFLDQWTKYLVVSSFRFGESLPIIDGFFNFTYVRNRGAAFSFMADADPAFRVPFFLIIPLIALVVIGYIFKQLPRASVYMPIALALVLGGAVGNLIDRARFQYVIDFLDFYIGNAHYPVFNIADSAICVGVGMMMIDAFRNRKKGEESASRPS